MHTLLSAKRRKKVKILLTDRTVSSLAAGTYFDTKTPAFGIRVGKHRKTWIVTKGRQRSVITIGHYPSMTLQEARQAAHTALGATISQRMAPAFPDALAAFLAQNRWRPRSLGVLKSSLNHFSWTRPINKITHEDIVTALDSIPHRSARAHALKDIRTFFNWCVPRYLAASPANGLKMPAYKPRERVLTNEELRSVWNAAADIPRFGAIVQLLILTGQRRGEIASLRWENVTADTLTFPETKNGRSHTIPLGILAAITLPVAEAEGFVFPATHGEGAYNGWGKHFKDLQNRSGTSEWTLHDLRRTFATNLAALGTPIHVTEKLLNHVSGSHGGIVGVYQRHAYWEEQKAAIAAWESKLQSLVR